MPTLSSDPNVAEKQMNAIIFYLTTFGHIDGHFDGRERSFVRAYIERVVGERVASARKQGSDDERRALTAQYTAYFHAAFERIDLEVQELFNEAVSRDEAQDNFVHSRLKLRCFEIFQSFDKAGQEQLMETLDELLMADGEAHAAEVAFRAELASLLEADLSLALEDDASEPRFSVATAITRPLRGASSALFAELEQHYSRDKAAILRQLQEDRAIVQRATATMLARAEKGRGKLAGKQRVDQLPPGASFVDGHVAVCRPTPSRSYDLTVLGDLHGCYSCLKAALDQSAFLEKLAAYEAAPEQTSVPYLVLLGDYIDRGMFSLNGVLRAVLTLYLRAPEHVLVLRGNHEYFLEFRGEIYGGVKPSEAIDTLKPHVPAEVFRDYIALFDAMPSLFMFDRTLFVHGGIPRDKTLGERYRDLASLDDADLRFEMLWSDPVRVDVVPRALQEQSSRFGFGRLQAAQFLKRMGVEAVVRGHEKVNAGFEVVYGGPEVTLCTVFSSGGAGNDDLPSNSSYRNVTPMALSVAYAAGKTTAMPWPIEYEGYNSPDANAFFRAPPELRFGG
jgi:Calcineurin-like phosphoesterase